jgi:zinc transport system ATP-binding protein
MIEGLSFAYEKHLILEDVDLSIGERDFVSIVGPNGGGKTTLLKIILGLLSPAKGKVRVFGRPPVEMRSRIGYVPQHAPLDPKFPVNVMDLVLMGRIGDKKVFRPYSREDKKAVERALSVVMLDEYKNVPFSALSGGQQQRVLIARALSSEPDLLLLDEPTMSLDIHIESEFYQLLNQLNERLTVVMVSHDLGFVSQFVRTVVCVKRNVVVHPTAEITGEIINEIYGTDVKIVRHNHFNKG